MCIPNRAWGGGRRPSSGLWPGQLCQDHPQTKEDGIGFQSIPTPSHHTWLFLLVTMKHPPLFSQGTSLRHLEVPVGVGGVSEMPGLQEGLKVTILLGPLATGLESPGLCPTSPKEDRAPSSTGLEGRAFQDQLALVLHSYLLLHPPPASQGGLPDPTSLCPSEVLFQTTQKGAQQEPKRSKEVHGVVGRGSGEDPSLSFSCPLEALWSLSISLSPRPSTQTFSPSASSCPA